MIRNCKGNILTYNAFALTARIDNVPLHPGLFHVGDGRAVSARTMPPYTQGAAALYPGLCSSALTARVGHGVLLLRLHRKGQRDRYHCTLTAIVVVAIPMKNQGEHCRLSE